MAKPRLFIGSSTERLPVAKALQNLVGGCADAKVWNEADEFALGESTLDGLVKVGQVYDFALLVFGQDDSAMIRGAEFATVRDNVIFELGLLMGTLGRGRAFWLSPQGAKAPRTMTDLSGIIHLEFDEPALDDPAGISKSLLSIRDAIDKQIRLLGPRPADPLVREVQIKRVLCLASSQYSQKRFDMDIEYIHGFFPGGVTHERGVTADVNTSFRYELNDDTGKKVARAGLQDLDVCLPYTLAFVSEIESVDYWGHLVSLEQPEEERIDGQVQFLSVITADAKGATETSSIAVLSDGLTTIAMPIEHTDNGVRILPLRPEVPRLFCDFPLLGTESFPFPVIVNNPTFNPTEPRDGVVLTKNERSGTECDENRTIINEAYALYLVLLDFASTNEWENLHLLAAAKPMPAFEWVDQKWYTAEILKPMQVALLQEKIVRTAADTIASIQAPGGKSNIWFPSNANPIIRRRIWRCCSTWIPDSLPAKPDIDAWYGIIWPECKRLTLDEVAALIEEDDTTKKLDGELGERTDVHKWLNEFYATLKLSEHEFLAVVDKRRIFPNQNGTFKKKADLSRDAGDIDPALLDILKLLGTDLRDHLLDPAIDTVFDDLAQKDGSFVVNQITAAVSKIINDRNAMDQRRPALSALLVWFHQHKAKAEKLFAVLYQQKHRLIDDDQMIENAQHADQLKQLLTRYNVKDVDELQAVIEKHAAASPLLAVTQQIIASLGITSLEEWEKALDDKDLAALFPYEPKTTPQMFMLAQSLIRKAKARVKAHLLTLKEYDLSQMDETALTLFAGVKKDDRDVTIVFRPAYDNTVIIYYQSEKDVLDYEDHELWVDTGKDVRRITFGHILKTNSIRRFPI